jgi:hypothetical protein
VNTNATVRNRPPAGLGRAPQVRARPGGVRARPAKRSVRAPGPLAAGPGRRDAASGEIRPTPGGLGPTSVAASLILPLQVSPGSLDQTAQECAAYADWLGHAWENVAALLEFTVEAGLLDKARVAAALDLADAGDTRAIYGLTGEAQEALGQHLSAAVSADALDSDAVLSVSAATLPIYEDGEADRETPCIAVEAQATILECRVPLFDMPEEVANACYRACRVIETRFRVGVTAWWDLDSASWMLIERQDCFEALADEVVASPQAFHQACLVEAADGCGLLDDGTESVGAANQLLDHLRSIRDAQERLRGLRERVGQVWTWDDDIGQLRGQAVELQVQFAGTAWAPWAGWVETVCQRVLAAAERQPLDKAQVAEDFHGLSVVLRIDIGLPWHREATADMEDQVAQTGEAIGAFFEWTPGRAAGILDALHDIADVCGLILATPQLEDSPC